MSTEKKVVALVTIHKTVEPGKPGDKNAGIAPTKPKVMEIEPGTIMMVGKDEYKELKALKAIRDYTEEELKAYEKMGLVVNTDTVVQSDGTEHSDSVDKAAADRAAIIADMKAAADAAAAEKKAAAEAAAAEKKAAAEKAAAEKKAAAEAAAAKKAGKDDDQNGADLV